MERDDKMSEEKVVETVNEEVEVNQQEETAETTEKSTKTKKAKKDKNQEKLKELQETLDKEKDARLRLAAEYDNFRKRTATEKLNIYSDATAKSVEALLPVADSLTMALQSMQDAPQEFIKGFELVSNQLKASFEKLGVEAFCEIGDEFDPNLHNAVAKIESEDFGENQISAVFQKGYKMGDKIIRHAMVQVAN